MIKKNLGALPQTLLKGLGPLSIPVMVILLAWTVTFAGAAVIEPEPDLQGVMGDLYGMAAAMRMFYDDTHKNECPALDEIAYYFKTPLPDGWPADYQTAGIGGDWWVGRKVPEFSTARGFLRNNGSSLGIYEQGGQSEWMGGAFAWMRVLVFNGAARPAEEQPVLRAAQGEDADNQHLFFNSPGTDYYWKSGLVFTTGGHAGALEKFGTGEEGAFVTSAPAPLQREIVTAPPVEVPPDFSLNDGQEDPAGPSIGDVIINPIPRQQDE